MNFTKFQKIKNISTILVIFSIVALTILTSLYLKAIYKRDHLESFRSETETEIQENLQIQQQLCLL